MTTAPNPALTFESAPIAIDEQAPGYRHARMAHFVGVALRHRDAWQQHKDNGQFDVLPAYVPGEAEPRPIRALPAVQHCLVEGARAGVLGNMLGLPEDATSDLEKAAVLHDSYKAKEVVAMLEQKPSWDSYAAAQEAAHDSWMAVPGRFTESVLQAASSVAHESIPQMEEILAKPTEELTIQDKLDLAMHYLDDYTVEFDFAKPAEKDGNDLDRRMVKNENNERYKGLNETGREHFNGETAYQAQRRVGKLVEARLADLVREAQGLSADTFKAEDLPVIIDNNIKQQLLAAMGK